MEHEVNHKQKSTLENTEKGLYAYLGSKVDELFSKRCVGIIEFLVFSR